MTLICWFFCVVVYFDAYKLPTLSELVEPSALSANKRAKISPPSPGSKEFQLLPAVSPTYAFSFCNFYFSKSCLLRDALDTAVADVATSPCVDFGSVDKGRPKFVTASLS